MNAKLEKFREQAQERCDQDDFLDYRQLKDILPEPENVIEFPKKKLEMAEEILTERPDNVIDLESKKKEKIGRLKIPRDINLIDENSESSKIKQFVFLLLPHKQQDRLPVGEDEAYRLTKLFKIRYANNNIHVMVGPIDSLSKEILEESPYIKLIPIFYLEGQKQEVITEKDDYNNKTDMYIDAPENFINRNYM